MASEDHQSTPEKIDLPIELQDSAGHNMARNATLVIVAGVIAFICWAAFAPIEEVAVATGKVVPTAGISNVHHLEGGIVDNVHVTEGQRVKQGDVLVALRPAQTLSDFSQLDARAANLRMKRTRLTASILGTEPDFDADGERFPAIKKEHMQTFSQERLKAQENERELHAAMQVIAEQLNSARGEVESLKAQVALQSEQVKIREKSHAKGYTSLNTLLQAKSVLEQTKQRLGSTHGRVNQLAHSLEEAQIKQREAKAERQSKLTEERSEVAAQLAEAEEALGKYRDRVVRLNVTAPTDGIVQKLAYSSRGSVIKPGDLVAQIIPEGSIMAEVRLLPQDIGHVSVGNTAEIQLSNFDVNAIGKIGGTVDLISATTFETKDGIPYYKARIRFDRDRLLVSGQEIAITPGTTLQAHILTDSRSLMRYMLKPVNRSFQTAFSER